MITIFHGTARKNSNSKKIADIYNKILGEKNVQHFYFTLENVEQDVFNATFYTQPKNAQLVEIENGILAPTDKYIFVIPEYHGSFPGMFKGFIDACDVKKCFHNKKACLVGVSDGRAGNLRGMEHLTNIFNHLRMNVMHLKLPLSQISSHLDAEGNLAPNDEYLKMINDQIEMFLEF
jgi:NAD(P)H-dependent FMN reductase